MASKRKNTTQALDEKWAIIQRHGELPAALNQSKDFTHPSYTNSRPLSLLLLRYQGDPKKEATVTMHG